jgi:Tol biopolymer transport system component
MPDGQHIVFRYKGQLAMRLANGGERKTIAPLLAYPDSVSRDGRFVLFGMASASVYELFALDMLTPGAKPIPLVTGRTVADEGRFSPNGRWVAYHSNEGSGVQVSVIPFPPTGEKWQISQTGGVQPRWSKDGQELFYLDFDGRLMSVRMPESDPRRAGTPTALFATGLVPSNSLDQFEPVGDRFLLRVPAVPAATASPIAVVVNWTRIGK